VQNKTHRKREGDQWTHDHDVEYHQGGLHEGELLHVKLHTTSRARVAARGSTNGGRQTRRCCMRRREVIETDFFVLWWRSGVAITAIGKYQTGKYKPLLKKPPQLHIVCASNSICLCSPGCKSAWLHLLRWSAKTCFCQDMPSHQNICSQRTSNVNCSALDNVRAKSDYIIKLSVLYSITTRVPFSFSFPFFFLTAAQPRAGKIQNSICLCPLPNRANKWVRSILSTKTTAKRG